MQRRWAGTALVVSVVVGAVVGCSSENDAARGEDGQIIKAGATSVFDLVAGDCVQPAPGLALKGIKHLHAVPCGEPHSHEVSAIAPYKDPDVYPGPKTLEAFADAACYDAFEGYIGRQLPESVFHLSYLVPSFASWTDGDDHQVICFVVTDAEPLVGSVRGSNR